MVDYMESDQYIQQNTSQAAAVNFDDDFVREQDDYISHSKEQCCSDGELHSDGVVSEWDTPSTSNISDDNTIEDAGDNSPLPLCDAIGRDDWKGRTVEARYEHGNKFATVLITATNSSMSVDGENELGDTRFGIVVYQIFEGDSTLRDMCITWPTKLLFYNNVSVYDHLRKHAILLQEEQLQRMDRKGKRKYDTSNRPYKGKRTQHWRIDDDEISKVYMGECCHRHCIRMFAPDVIRSLRYEMFLNNPEDKRMKNLEVHRAKFSSTDGKEQLVMLEFKEVCIEGWKLIHGVSSRTFRRYGKGARNGERGRPHGNVGKSKPRASTLQATQTLGTIIDGLADSMPYPCTLPSGERVPQKLLPTGIRWNQFLPQMNKVNIQVGLKPISATLLSRIRISKYADYRIKRRGDSFSRCSKCDTYTTLKNSAVRGSKEQKEWTMKFNKHTRAQWAARNGYWSDRLHSVDVPSEFLCILHDKMDHSKTALPCLKSRTKDLDALLKLPISVVGMYAHGHGDMRYAHYTVDVFPNDSNFTIGSIAKLLRDLEEVPARETRLLFRENESNSLYKAVLLGKEMCLPSLGEPTRNTRVAQGLPPILHVQMDNCWRENKNRYLFCFWSLLVAKRIVKEVVVSFMMVGHTHDDIDASFGRWSMVLKERDNPTLPMLMKSYMDLDKDAPMIPHLIEEVPDFKKFIAPYIEHSRTKRLQGHSKGSQFRFFLHEDGWPLMQYKLACTEKEWKPTHVPGIKLWKEDNTGKPILPPDHVQPHAVKPNALKNEAELLKGIDGYISYYNELLKAEVTTTFRTQHLYYVEYWTGVRDAIQSMKVRSNIIEGDRIVTQKNGWAESRTPTQRNNSVRRVREGSIEATNAEAGVERNDAEDTMENTDAMHMLDDHNAEENVEVMQAHDNYETVPEEGVLGSNSIEERMEVATPLRYGFWPQTRLVTNIVTSNQRRPIPEPELGNVGSDGEDGEEPYIGTLEDRPPPPFAAVNDIRKGFFVFVRPGEGCDEPIWLGKVMEHPQMNASLPEYKRFKVRWWIPDNTGETMADLYRGWNTSVEFPYKLDYSAKMQDAICTDNVLASWKPSKGRTQIAPAIQIQFAVDNLRRIMEHERRVMTNNYERASES